MAVLVETLLHEARQLQSQVQSIGDNPSLDILQRKTVSTERLYERILKEHDSASDATPSWETSCKSFVEVVCALYDTVDVLIDKLKQTNDELTKVKQTNDELTKKLAEVTKTLQELRRKHAMLEEIEQKLVVGQIAFEIDKLVLEVVLKGIGSRQGLGIFNIGAMEKAIKKKDNYSDAFKSEAERQKVAMRWNTLKSNIRWEGRHYRYIRELKDLRLNNAHPKMDAETMRKALAQLHRSENITTEMMDMCEEFLIMMEIIPELEV